MEAINEFPKILYGAEDQTRIVTDQAGEDAAREEGFVTVGELAGEDAAKPVVTTKKGK